MNEKQIQKWEKEICLFVFYYAMAFYFGVYLPDVSTKKCGWLLD